MNNNNKLFPLEWLLVLLFCLSLLALSFFSWLKADTSTYLIDEKEETEVGWIKSPMITYSITGAVEQSGDFQVERGVKLKEAVKLARPLPDADLSKLKLETIIKHKQRIRIPLKRKRLRKISQL